ncbi:MAG TPA: hypothetical protein VII53_10085 [Solirubrobacteraceae bacterium]
MSYDISRLRRSDQIVGGGAIALFIFLFFFKWYGASASSSVGGISIGGSLNGWHSFTNSRWIWLITIIVALGAVALRAGQRELDLPVQSIIAGLGALSTLLILYRIIHHPSGGASGGAGLTHFSYSYGIKIGIWLGLIAAAAITYGGYLGMQAEGAVPADAHDQGSQALGGAAAPASSPSEGSAPGAATGGAFTAAPPSVAPSAPAAPAPPSAAPAAPAPPPIPPPVAPPSSDA